MTAWAPVLAIALGAAPASGSSRRVALLVAHPFGGDELAPLRYTANDLDRVREVLDRVGDFEPGDILLSFGEDAGEVAERFAEARARLQAGDGGLFLFYYSGHAKDGELRLGDTRLSLHELKRLIEQTGAPVQVALLDSCRAGSITRLKGATKGEPITVAVEQESSQAGLVLITASSEHEDAQESDEIQGSFFTHFLTTGLRGAADDNGDGSITLAEGYAFAYSSTVAGTAGTRGGTQHPTYHFDLRGAGDLVLTRPGRPTSAVLLPPELAGHVLLFDLGRRVVVAELHKPAGAGLRLAVQPGEYAVKLRQADHLRIERLAVSAGATVAADPARMERVAFADDYAKGEVVSRAEVTGDRLGLRLSAGLGVQAFLSAPVRDDYFPTLGVLQVALDLDNLFGRRLGLRLDAGLGGSGERTLALEDPHLGAARFAVEVSELTLGAALAARWPLSAWAWAGGSARLGFVSVSRRFVNEPLPQQSFSTLTPGLGAFLDVRLLGFLSAGLRLRVHYMYFNVDEPLSLAYIDGGLVLTAVLR